MTSNDAFQHDPNWPPQNNSRIRSAFTQKEDQSILEYLLKTHSFTALGGNEIWKKMATSRKYNSGQRTFHSLRERYRKHLRTRLGQYVNPRQQELLLNLPPGTVSKASEKNKMISKEDAREEIERGRRPAIGTNSHFFDLEAGDQQPTNNRRTANTSSSHSPCPQDTRPADDRLVNVLRERRHLLSRSTAQKTLLSSSTPLRPDRGADAGNQVVEKRLKDVVANRKVDTQRQISVERRSEDEALPAWSGRNIGTSQEINLRAQRAFETHHTVELRISSGLEFCFKFEHLDSPLKKSTLDQFLRSAQARLRDMLFWHGKPLEEGRQSCSNENCVGLEAYLDCWVELEAALLKAEQYEGSSSHPFFVRLLAARLYELLRVPTCTLGTVWLDSELDPNDLYSFFCKDNLSWERRTVQAIIETASALRKALPKCVHVK